MTDFIDADKIKTVSEKRDKLVSDHITKLDIKNAKEYEKKLLDNNTK